VFPVLTGATVYMEDRSIRQFTGVQPPAPSEVLRVCQPYLTDSGSAVTALFTDNGT